MRSGQTRLATNKRRVPVKAILLDGSRVNDHTGERVRAALTAQLSAQGWEVEHVVLREKQIGACGGEFFCWIKHPGTCMLDDDNRVIAAATVASDLAVYLTPVTFGGYSSALKRMVDHMIQNISPFFATVEGETHHHKRYAKYPDFMVLGWMQEPDARSETVFRHLVQRNAINWHAETYLGDVVLASQTDDELAALAQGWLDDLRGRRSSPQVELPAGVAPLTALGAGPSDAGPAEIKRALLLVGSPKRLKSNSNALGSYLIEQLDAQSTARSIECETICLHSALRSPEKTQALLDAVDAADLIALTFPLYVDSLPAPVIDALERIAAHRGRDASRSRFVALANSGFPEMRHNAPALAICETFARHAGFEWAGGLSLGAGGVVGGVPLAENGGRTMGIRVALDLAAEALASGKSIPDKAQELLAKPVIPHWAYRLMGNWGFRQMSKKYGARKQLKARPYPAGAE
jgi:multimeric flavodoxin WrbA